MQLMQGLASRVPNIDWSAGFARHWNGTPAATHIFNALSFLFPDGERYFIRVAREAASQLDLSARQELAEAVRGFLAQESVHSRQHASYNTVLEAQGYKNVVRDWMLHMQRRSFERFSALTRLAVVCAFEHYTAILGDYLLRNWSVIGAAPPQMATVWGWHAVEESEHKAVCFDLYQVAGGRWLRRVLAFGVVTMNFTWVFTRLYWNMLRYDSALSIGRLAGTLRDLSSLFFGRRGVGWYVLYYALAYLSPGFHPRHRTDEALLRAWLDDNRDRLRVMNGGPVSERGNMQL